MEHAYVIEDLRRTLSPVCDSLEVPDKPAVLELRNVSHLATRISGVLSAVTAAATAQGDTAGNTGDTGNTGNSGNSGNSSHALPQSPLCEDDSAHPGFDALSALELVARVHPTPAVGGTPTEAAVAYIGEAEGFDRGRYAGPVGWMPSATGAGQSGSGRLR